MRTHSPCLIVPLLALALANTVGCGEELTPKTKLKSPRILAVQADPVNPGVGESSTFTPLVYLPPGETAAYSWSWCPVPTNPDDGYLCPLDQAGLDALTAALGLAGVPPLDLGTDSTAVFTNPFPTALAAAVCANDPAVLQVLYGVAAAAGSGATPGLFECGLATMPVQIKLVLLGATDIDVGVFSLNVPIDDTTPRNLNPVVRGLWDMTTPPGVRVDDVGSVIVPIGAEVEVAVDMDETVSETILDRITLPDGEYQRDAAGNLVLGPSRERITVSWFKERGGLDKGSTGFNIKARDAQGNPIPFDVARKNTWTAPEEAAAVGTTARLIAVVRDGRGGVAWTSGVFGLGVAR